VLVNGLGFEGWLERLIDAAGYRGPVAVTSEGVATLALEDEHGHGAVDPHAWQSLANGRTYVANVARALKAADPAGAATYDANAAAYLAEIEALDQELRESFAALSPERRTLVTSHDAFAYFAHAYDLEVLAPQGAGTESEASAADVAALIRQIRDRRIPAVFVENVTDPRLLEQITRETDARIGGTLYSDALSDASGPAPTYLAMFRHNLRTLLAALTA
jgi:zinc/manganese transport system substrate-binding protein